MASGEGGRGHEDGTSQMGDQPASAAASAAASAEAAAAAAAAAVVAAAVGEGVLAMQSGFGAA